jgi:Alb1
MKRGQRARQERGLARAEVVMDQLARKMEGAQSRDKKRRDRRAIWEEVNDASKEEKRKAPKFQGLANGVNWVDEDGWEDEPQTDGGDTEMKVVDGVEVPATAPATKLVVVDRTASATASDVDDFDGIT